MTVAAFDHVAIPTARPEEMLRFYYALGFTVPTLDDWRASEQLFFSIQFGENKINVHAPVIWQNPAFTLRGHTARPGCGDFCFVWSGTVNDLMDKLDVAGARIEEGPVARVGGRDDGRAVGTSIYTRDPDDNLLEFIIYGGAV
jgi:catechol 2,3-dioxygenase-like lactoylglutathione lyase family enzyme